MPRRQRDRPVVAVIMGSRSDLAEMRDCLATLRALGLRHTRHVLSAHRQPAATARFAEKARAAGYRVLIAGAGMAAHLAGALAARTTLPIIGVPLSRAPFEGTDAFVSTLQMPSGIPVATMSVGRAGAVNAALLAARILALEDASVAARLKTWRG